MMFNLLRYSALLALTAGTLPLAAATIGARQDFESGTTAGWTGGASPSNQPSGGPQGADDNFLLLTSDGGNGAGSRLAAFHLGEDWTGDYLAAGVRGLNVDLMSPTDSAELAMRVVLFGPSTPNNRWTSTDAFSVPNDGIWRTYHFPIDGSSLTSVQGGATVEAMLADVVRLMLRHDPGSPSAMGESFSGQVGIDNLVLVGNPLDCHGDGEVGGSDLSCIVAAGGAEALAALLAETGLLPGDLDGDGTVAFADFLVLSANFGKPVTSYTDGDINADGAVNFADFLLLSNNFGKAASTLQSSVPEPQCWPMVTALLLLWPWHRQRRREVQAPAPKDRADGSRIPTQLQHPPAGQRILDGVETGTGSNAAPGGCLMMLCFRRIGARPSFDGPCRVNVRGRWGTVLFLIRHNIRQEARSQSHFPRWRAYLFVKTPDEAYLKDCTIYPWPSA